MTSRETTGPVFADTQDAGIIRSYVSRMLAHRRERRERYPEEWSPFAGGGASMDYYCSAASYVISAVASINPLEATRRLEEVDEGMSVQVAIEKELGATLTNCIYDENMTLEHFFVYAEMGIVYSSMTGNRPAADLMRRYLDEPDECLI